MGSIAAVNQLPKHVLAEAYRNQVIGTIVLAVLFGVGVGAAYHTLFDKDIVSHCTQSFTSLFCFGCFGIYFLFPLGIIFGYFRWLSFDVACKKSAGIVLSFSITLIVATKVTQISICILLPKLFANEVEQEACLAKASTYGDLNLAEDVFTQASKRKVMRPKIIKYAPNLNSKSLKRQVIETCLSYENTLKECFNEAVQCGDESVQLPVFLQGLQNPLIAPNILEYMKKVPAGDFKQEILHAALTNPNNVSDIFNAMCSDGEKVVEHDPAFVKKVISKAKEANISLKLAVPIVAQTKDDALIKEVWLKEIVNVTRPMDVVEAALRYGNDDITKTVCLKASQLNRSNLNFDLTHKICKFKNSDVLIHLLKNGFNVLDYKSTVTETDRYGISTKTTKTKYSLLFLAVKHEMEELVDYLVLHHVDLIDQKQTVHRNDYGVFDRLISEKSPIDLAIEKNLKDIAFILFCAGAKVSEAKLRSKGWGHFLKDKVDRSLYIHLDLLGIDRKAKLTFDEISKRYKKMVLANRADGRTQGGDAAKIEKAKKAKTELCRWLSYKILDLDPNTSLTEHGINSAVSKQKKAGVDVKDLKTAKETLTAVVSAKKIENDARNLLGIGLNEKLTGPMITRACNNKTDSLSNSLDYLKNQMKANQKFIRDNQNRQWMKAAIENAEREIANAHTKIAQLEKQIDKYTDAKNVLFTSLPDKDM